MSSPTGARYIRIRSRIISDGLFFFFSFFFYATPYGEIGALLLGGCSTASPFLHATNRSKERVSLTPSLLICMSSRENVDWREREKERVCIFSGGDFLRLSWGTDVVFFFFCTEGLVRGKKGRRVFDFWMVRCGKWEGLEGFVSRFRNRSDCGREEVYYWLWGIVNVINNL